MRVAVILLLLGSSGWAETTVVYAPATRHHAGGISWLEPDPPRERTGLVLSGGGARGFAHLGVLLALQDAGIRPDYIVGTSIGGTLGGLYAAGYSVDSLIDIARRTNWERFLSNQPPRRSLFVSRRKEADEALIELHFKGLKPSIPTALSSGQNLADFLSNLTRSADFMIDGDFDRLPIPLRVVATDLVTGERVVIGTGNLGDALRSTIAVPLAFTPWESDGKLLADGGLVDPIPVDVARDLGADVVVAVDVTSPLQPREKLTDPLSLANQATSIMVLERLREQLKHADFVIQPDLRNNDNSNFGDLDSLIAWGREAAAPVVARLARRLRRDDAPTDSTDRTERSWRVVGTDGDAPVAVPYGERMTADTLARILAGLVRRTTLSEAFVEVRAFSDSARLAWYVDTLPAIARVEFAGNSLVQSDSLDRLVEPLLGRPFGAAAFESALDNVVALYRRRGYPLVEAQAGSLDPGGTLTIQVDEAPIVQTSVEGIHRTRESFIYHHVPQLRGEPLYAPDLDRGISSLYATDLFESVTARTVRVAGGTEVQFRVKEADYTRLRMGVHWDEEFHAEGFAELADINVLGMGNKAALFAMYGDRRKHYALHLSADRLFGSYLGYKFSAYHRRNQWYLYDRTVKLTPQLEFHRTGGTFSLGQQLRRFGLLSVGLRAEDVVQYVLPTPDTSHINIRALRVEAELDTYDRFPIPESGYRQRIVLEHANDVAGGTEQYIKFEVDIEGILPLRDRHVAALGISVGTADSRLPLSEQFVIGGWPNIIGLRSGFAGWRVGEGRGDHYWTGRFALRFHNGGPRYITVAYNLGNIWGNEDFIDVFDVVHGVALAYTIDSPVGPLDFAVGLAEHRPVIGYVNLGLAF